MYAGFVEVRPLSALSPPISALSPKIRVEVLGDEILQDTILSAIVFSVNLRVTVAVLFLLVVKPG